ncbi:MAG: hypothetical protein K6U80_19380 [Firmicutes bacterium]|nr:hypothetical protein [Bacillota bacterium]
MPRVKREDFSSLSGFFCFVEEPAFSKSKLENLQAKYGIDTQSFIAYEDFFTNVSAEDAKDWKFNYTIYINSGGVLDDLTPPVYFGCLDTLEETKIGQDTGEAKMSPPVFLLAICYERSILDE